MHQNENGEYVLSRREYTQLMAAVPASHATDDDGWLSGLFGDSSNDGPGLLEDVQYRHEDDHIITDPEIVDFVGAAVDIERPNDYDQAVRIRISGDLVVDGADIDPASIGKDTPAEEIHSKSHVTDDVAITNYAETADYVVRPIGGDYKAISGADGSVSLADPDFATVLQHAIDNAGADPGTGYANGGAVYIWPGEHTLNSTVTLDRNGLTIRGFGWRQTVIKAADGLNADMFTLTTTNSVVHLKMSDLRIDGNHSNNTSGRGLYIPGSADLKDTRFENFFIARTAGTGLYLGSGWGAVVYNSVFEQIQGDYAVYLGGSDPTFYGNKVITNPVNTAELYLNGSQNRVFGNHLGNSTTSAPAIHVEGNRNVIVNNRIQGQSAADDAIHVNGKRTLITHNQLIDPNRFGIWVALGQANTYANVSYNVIRAPGQDAVRFSGSGICNGNVVTGAGQDSAGSYPALNLLNRSITASGNFIDGESQTQYGISFDGTTDARGDGNTILNVTGSKYNRSTATRTLIDGLGYNAGDPNTTGQWNGNGIEGITVRDTTNANTYVYNNGSWSQIASA